VTAATAIVPSRRARVRVAVAPCRREEDSRRTGATIPAREHESPDAVSQSLPADQPVRNCAGRHQSSSEASNRR
jgi:hypothetical protein